MLIWLFCSCVTLFMICIMIWVYAGVEGIVFSDFRCSVSIEFVLFNYHEVLFGKITFCTALSQKYFGKITFCTAISRKHWLIFGYVVNFFLLLLVDNGFWCQYLPGTEWVFIFIFYLFIYLFIFLAKAMWWRRMWSCKYLMANIVYMALHFGWDRVVFLDFYFVFLDFLYLKKCSNFL